MTQAQALVALVVVVLGVAAAVRLVSERSPVPYPVLLAAAGLAIGLLPWFRERIDPEVILLGFVPGLVFEASLTLDLAELRRHLVPVGLLASAGVVLTVLLVGWGIHLLLGLDLGQSFLLGAIVAATDPVAVVELLRRSRAPAGVSVILEGESLFNDGTGVALFSAILAGQLSGHLLPTAVAIGFLASVTVAVAIGIACGLGGSLLLRRSDQPRLEILATLAIAYGSYLAADVVHASGIVASVCAGIVIATAGRRHPRVSSETHDFWSLLAFVLSAVLFVLIGATEPVREMAPVAGAVLAGYALMLVARAVPVYLLLGVSDPLIRRVPWAWRHLVVWGGMRGALSLALAIVAADAHAVDRRVSLVAFGMVALSLLVQGGLLSPAIRVLGLDRAAARQGP